MNNFRIYFIGRTDLNFRQFANEYGRAALVVDLPRILFDYITGR